MENKDLKEVYESMHKQGTSAWFSDGAEERDLILKMGEPWEFTEAIKDHSRDPDMKVLEIGCGEGTLVEMMNKQGALVTGIDYSETAINKARERFEKYYGMRFCVGDYKKINRIDYKFDRLVMQGVLEHLDYPFDELKWMMENLLTEKGDVITSSPCFLNPRGLIWMTLDMLGAVMSKTDLHFIHPWEMRKFANSLGYNMEWRTCDFGWAFEEDMVNDLKQRIPLALRDGNVTYKESKFNKYMEWLDSYSFPSNYGATAVYRIFK